MNVILVRHTENPELAIMDAISVCRDSIPKQSDIKFCYDSGHLSVFEFAVFHFKVIDCSRVLSHQLVRKRIASYMQESQRSVKCTKERVVVPPTIQANEKALVEYDAIISSVYQSYNTLINMGIPLEDARYILPEGAGTTIHINLNFRSLMEFCNERMCHMAQNEIRELSNEMYYLVREVSPLLAEYMVPKCVKDGKCKEHKSCGELARRRAKS